jgi:hypothetical protein
LGGGHGAIQKTSGEDDTVNDFHRLADAAMTDSGVRWIYKANTGYNACFAAHVFDQA